jgi:polysaccharide biosynthesis/export protein
MDSTDERDLADYWDQSVCCRACGILPPKARTMHNRTQAKAMRWGVALLAAFFAICSGCAESALQHHAPEEHALIHGAPGEQRPVGRELDKVSLPDYVIEPPDVLTIEALRVVPKSPYRIRPLDALQIEVEGTPVDQPIRGFFIVEPGGFVNLGPGYGKVKVSDRSLDEARDAVEQHLARTLRAPQVSLTLAEAAGVQSITGQHTVGPDGTINLGTYGSVYITGLTIEQARGEIERHLSQFLEEPRIAVEVYTFGSKVYYVITEGAGFGDNVQRFPVTGSETVLDAISQINGLSRLSSKNIWIARPAPGGECFQILPVKWDDIVRGGGTSTNYQILPGDRVFVEEDHIIALDSALAKLTAPFERILGTSLLGANTVQTYQRFPGGFNNQGGF